MKNLKMANCGFTANFLGFPLFAIALLALSNSLCANGDAAVEPNSSPRARSIAGLRSARALALEKKLDAAEKEYTKIVSMGGASAHHRQEADECLREIKRLRAGLPARDPLQSRGPPPRLPSPGAELHVAPSGSDANPGILARPFATLEGARDEIRTLKSRGGLPEGGVAVIVHGGEYRVTGTFRLGAGDGGTETAPVVYRAAPGERPRFRGGLRISGFRPVSEAAILDRLPEEARGKVVQVDLRVSGVKQVIPLRLGGFASGAGFRTWPAVEVFFDGEAMPLARWPNDGFIQIAEVTGMDNLQSHGRQGVKDGRFTYEGDRPRRWKGEREVWLYGYWFWDWADSYDRVASIDPERREIVIAPPYHRYGYRKGQRFRAINVLSEIDTPGEWYLDRETLTLYFWPPPAPERSLEDLFVELSQADFPLVELENVSHLALVGLTWELGGADGMIVKGGNRCLIAGCTVQCLGGNGIEVHGGTAHGILSCDIRSMGRGGVVLVGGDRRTLIPGGHFIENCHIRDLSRIDHTYTPGVRLEGVGNRISHNLVHGVLSSAFRVEGNDHRIEYNEVFDVLLESDDQGGADMFGNPTYRGDIFRYNWWHHIGSWSRNGEQPHCGQAGIRLDDAICGVLVYGNVFQKCSAGGLGFGGVQIHGGKENIVDNNLFLDCAAAISFSPWGERRWRESVRNALSRGGIDRGLYLARYPELKQLSEGHDSNHVWRNVALRCDRFLLRDPGRQELIENWVVPDDPGFAKASLEEFTGRSSPACTRIGFRPIPLDEIGLYRDEYRTSLPAELLRRARWR